MSASNPDPRGIVNLRAHLTTQLHERIMIIDGGMGTMVQSYRLKEEDFRGERFKSHHKDLKGNNDILCLTQPHIIKEIHTGYLEAGADILETNTFNGTTVSQSDYATQDLTYEINKAAAVIALECCYDVSRRTGVPRFVAGAMGPTNRTLSVSPSGMHSRAKLLSW